jgi:hypothetical protein
MIKIFDVLDRSITQEDKESKKSEIESKFKDGHPLKANF